MLAQFGSVTFEIQPVNLHELSHDTEAAFVDKPIMGRRPALEFVGDGPETFKLSVKLFPERFGGLGSLSDLDSMRKAGQSQYFMRGDGTPLGWFALTNVSEKSSYIGANGVGKVVDVEITLRRDDAPSADGFFASISGLF